ncbi:geranylgeranyl pyrophosphate synthase [Sphaerisporangium rufum]|uniref:Geranylgeranyl pyrophosphate synthase n=1 Tax=Sphaerisporangium rufum TaxID=1381558 RepID=A0A919R6B0_9ACTN|nr:polyprenyl synthetase family protein [Sphaerisporangium rufum]GII80299.1 geranylgeranyl pyrophosphate synthase [Sphaerisporangium rufum]
MPNITGEDLAGWLRAALAEVEDLLQDTVDDPRDPLSGMVAGHLLRAGGKRRRPALALLAARFGEFDRPAVRNAAAAVELLHVASLYHDDVMDEAATRRGVPSANARWGNRVAVLAGDLLVARAAELAAPLGAGALHEQTRMVTRLVSGQLREAFGPGDADPERFYLGVIADKTAALFALAAGLGARAAGVAEPAREALTAFGESYGIAFQLADDLLDAAAPAADTGKPAYADLRQGVATLPVLRATRRRGRGPARLRRLVAGGPITDPGRLATAARLLRRSPALAETRQEVIRHTARATGALDALPPGPARDALHAMCADLAAVTT